jgi:hypothetical protein
MENILIINQYSSTPKTGYAGRSFYLASELAKKHECALISSNYNHLLKNSFKQETKTEENLGFPFKIIALKVLKITNSRSIKRILNWILFSIKLVFLSKKSIGFIPTKIIYSSPSLISYLGAYFLARKFKCKLYFEVRDIWPLTIKSFNSKYEKSFLIKPMEIVEKFAYETCNGLISNLSSLPDYVEKITNKKPPFLFLPNGISKSEEMNSISDSYQSNEARDVLSKINILKNSGKIVVCYCGGLSQANAMELFVNSAFSTKDDLSIFWLIIGDGPEKEKLKDLSRSFNLKNLDFYPSVRKKEVLNIYKSVDILFLANNFLDLYKYGISPMKLPEYLISGTPIIHVTNSKSLLDELKCWSVVSIFDKNAVSNEVYKISNMDKAELKRNSEIAIRSARKFLSYENLANELDEFLSSY